MSVKQVFAYQPIVDSTPNPVAIELIYREPDLFDDSVKTAANIVLNAFVHAGPAELPRRRLTYIAAPAQLLASGLLEQLSPEMFVLELRGQEAGGLVEQCKALKQAGYQLALDNVAACAADLDKLLPHLNVVRLDAHAALTGAISQLPQLRASGVRLLAEGIDGPDMVEQLQMLGFSLFQGYHFAHAAKLAVARADPRKMAVLDLLSKLSSNEDDPVIEEAFKANPALALDLLKLVNSSAFALKTRIRSIKHAFAIVGRKELERWMRVLLFAFDCDSQPSPLMELALRRARFMEFVLTYRTHARATVLQDEAYMTGLLSLVDVLLGWSMQECVKHFNLVDEIRAALLNREGTLGKLIDLCEALEAADFDAALPIAEDLHLPIESVMTAQNVALAYSEHVGSFSESADHSAPKSDTQY